MTFEDLGIEGVKYGVKSDQAVKCPKCSADRKKKNDRCLSVNVGDGVYNCHHCGWSGSINSREAVDTYTKPDASRLEIGVTEPIEKWFNDRGIRRFTLQFNRIFEQKEFMPQEGKEMNCICFPYRRDGEVINIKFRDGKKNFKQVKGAEKILYGLDDIQGRDEVIICEGEMDKMSFDEIGMTNSISVPDGAPAVFSECCKSAVILKDRHKKTYTCRKCEKDCNIKTPNYSNKFEYLENCAHYLVDMKKVYIAVDIDAAGLELREELARRIGKSICYIVEYPDDCKDANEVLVKHGEDVLRGCIDKAEPYPVEDVISVSQIEQEIYDLYEHGLDRGISLGYDRKFDELLTFITPLLTVVTGIPSHGKSNMIEMFSVIKAVKHNYKFALFSPEHYPMSLLFQRLAKLFTGAPFFSGKTPRMTRSELKSAMDMIGSRFWFIRPTGENFTLDAILDATKGLILRYGVNELIIDPWNSLTHVYDGSETKYIEEALNKINRFKVNYNCNVTIIAHPTKQKKRDDGLFEIPNLYSISGSQHFFNKTDIGLTVYRNFDTQKTEVHVQKVKYEHLGKLGVATFKFNPVNSRFYETGTDPYNETFDQGGDIQGELGEEESWLPYKDASDDPPF